MAFTESETEATTAATDALLGLVCLGAAVVIMATVTTATWSRTLWTGAFALLGCGSLLGAVAHGVQMRESRRLALWVPLYLTLGLAVALVGVGAVHDWRGPAAASRVLPWAVAAAALFLGATFATGGRFVIFIAYEAVVLIAAFVIYCGLALRGAPAGAPALALGLGLSLAAAGVQVTAWRVRVVWTFDHNGLFHLVQMAAIVALAAGVRANLLGA